MKCAHNREVIFDRPHAPTSKLFEVGRPMTLDISVTMTASLYQYYVSWTADKGWSSSLRVGEGLTIPHHKEKLIKICHTGTWNWGALVNTVTNHLIL